MNSKLPTHLSKIKPSWHLLKKNSCKTHNPKQNQVSKKNEFNCNTTQLDLNFSDSKDLFTYKQWESKPKPHTINSHSKCIMFFA